MSQEQEPAWDLLPHDPERFFGLSGDYDVRTLKRAYNRLIRRFKPEQFPLEFQRIRAAFEELHDALRYDLPTRRPPETVVPIPTPAEKPAADVHRSASIERTDQEVFAEPSRTEPIPIFQRLDTESPEALHAELAQRRPKTPSDYVTLALMADAIEADPPEACDTRSFVDWLLSGLREYPEDWGMTRLLREYVATMDDRSRLMDVLIRAVDILPGSRFLYATEKAWDRLIREAPFDEIRDCLKQCEDKLAGDHRDDSLLVFNIHILKPIIWKADAEFVGELKETIDDHYHSLEHSLQIEYDLTASLVEYHAVRSEFINRGPCCRRIDQAIRDWCLLPEHEGDLSVLDCQYFISSQEHRLLDEFPDWKAGKETIPFAWREIVMDVLERLPEPEPIGETVARQRVRNVLVRMARRNSQTISYALGFGILLLFFPISVTVVVGAASLVIRAVWEFFTKHNFLLGLGNLLLAVGMLLAGCTAAYISLGVGRRITALRYRDWRRDLLSLLRIVPWEPIDVAKIVVEFEDEEYGDGEQIAGPKRIAPAMVDDPCLELFSLAQFCIHAAAPVPAGESPDIDAAALSR